MLPSTLLIAALLLAEGPAGKPEPPMPPDEAEVLAKERLESLDRGLKDQLDRLALIQSLLEMKVVEAERLEKERREAETKKKQEAEAKARIERTMQRRAMVAGMRGNGWILPRTAPTAARRERFLLLVPQGPLVVEASLTIDGQPYWTHREAMIAELLRGDPKVDEGRVSWLSILKNPRTANGRFASFMRNEQFIQQQAQQFDTDGDGFADREEAQVFFAQSFGGAALTMMNYPVQQMQIPVAKVLDTDGDGRLSAAELAAAPARLASRDADDNELLDATELTGINPYGGAYVGQPGAGRQVQLVASIDDGFDPQHVSRLLVARYGKDGKLSADSLARQPAFFSTLDANADGQLQPEELQKLEQFPPQVVLEVNLGKSGSLPAGVVVRQVAPELQAKAPAAAGERLALELAGVKLQVIGASPPMAYNYDAQVQNLLTLLDTDKNGYIEKQEAESQQGYAQQFTQWDANDDGKVYADEIKATYDRMQAPALHSVSIGGVELANSLWEAIDSNGDGTLSLRERLEAPARLKLLDADRNGQIAAEEIVPTVRLAVARGQYAYQYLINQPNAYRPPGQPAALPGPSWFHRMDRNGDGDVTRREFLGSEEQFRSLDANGDGILELKEVGTERQK